MAGLYVAGGGRQVRLSTMLWLGAIRSRRIMAPNNGPYGTCTGLGVRGSLAMGVGYVYDPIFLQHVTGNHPESPARLVAIMEYLQRTGLLRRLVAIPAVLATTRDLERVHSERMISLVANLSERGGGRIDVDTWVSRRSFEAALYAAGATIAAVQACLEGKVTSAYALVRPPGHHATPRQSMGFCLFNNVAIAAEWAREVAALPRVCIVDFDVHHGNGTDDRFDVDPSVFYVSLHQYPLYPGTGDWRRPTHVRGVSNNLNIPLPAETGDEGYQRIFETLVVPAVRRFRPELILVSAGYDAHWSDPLATLAISLKTYRYLSETLLSLSRECCPGRLAFTLEGGYDLDVLAHGVGVTFSALLGLDSTDPFGPSGLPEAPVDALINRLADWHMIDLPA
jgi:acetoin utilization deacetylase AcuC-like enzyme